MLKSLVETECFKKLRTDKDHFSHAYFFYSKDKVLNENIAVLFAMSVFCNSFPPCFECDACKRNLLDKNPDLMIVDKPNIMVEDILEIIDKALIKPMIFNNKIVLIKNADVINESAQNKLLKLLEEPNDSLIFILTSNNEEKLLPTVKSRLKKVYLSLDNKDKIKDELLNQGVKSEYVQDGWTLTEMYNNSHNKDFLLLKNNIETAITNLKNTQNIPKIVYDLKLSNQNKYDYLSLFAKMFDSISKDNNLFASNVINELKTNYPLHLVAKIKGIIEKAYKRLKANVNVNYVFDCLLFEILKEKYLCKQ